MSFTSTIIPEVKIFEPNVFKDDRGYFFESYNKKVFKEAGISIDFVQDNQSSSTYGVLRGLHYQVGIYAQTKLVRVLKGRILDVAVDIRKDSQTYKKWVAVELSEDNFKQIYIPKGFAHGFVVLSEVALISYKCDNFYHPESEAGIRYDDTDLKINWGIENSRIIVSERDKKHPFLKELK